MMLPIFRMARTSVYCSRSQHVRARREPAPSKKSKRFQLLTFSRGENEKSIEIIKSSSFSAEEFRLTFAGNIIREPLLTFYFRMETTKKLFSRSKSSEDSIRESISMTAHGHAETHTLSLAAIKFLFGISFVKIASTTIPTDDDELMTARSAFHCQPGRAALAAAERSRENRKARSTANRLKGIIAI